MDLSRLFAGAIAGACLFAASGIARADVVESLQALSASGPVTVGNATYTNFFVNDSTIDPATITVDISGSSTVSTITFTPASPWTTGSPDDATVLTYDVAFAAPITSIGLAFNATGAAGAVASVPETATDTVNGIDYSLQVLTDGAGPLADNFSNTVAAVPPTTALSILKSIDIAGSGSASISSVTQTYAAPEPASLSLLMLGALPLLRRRSRG